MTENGFHMTDSYSGVINQAIPTISSRSHIRSSICELYEE